MVEFSAMSFACIEIQCVEFMLMLVTVQMQMETSTTLILQPVIVYGTIHVMNTIGKWSSKRNENVQVM